MLCQAQFDKSGFFNLTLKYLYIICQFIFCFYCSRVFSKHKPLILLFPLRVYDGLNNLNNWVRIFSQLLEDFVPVIHFFTYTAQKCNQLY